MSNDDAIPPETHDGYARQHLGKTPLELAAMCDSELDVWQSRHPPGSHQFSRAEREWQRRLVAEQLKAIFESNFIAREANAVARSAKNIAFIAAITAIAASVIAAIV